MHPKVIASLHYILLASEQFHRNALFLYNRRNLYANSKSLCCPPETRSMICQYLNQGFPAGSVAENLPASAGHRGSIPGLGRFPRAMEQRSPCASTTTLEPRSHGCWAHAPQRLKPAPQSLCSATRSHCSETPARSSWRAAPPLATTREKPTRQGRPSTAKNNK